ncbi:MAG: acyl-CoA carboxylase subunit beta [Thermoplasmata archaeon]|nr:MAG: acyl-CoA carboxylase subunit beta [Thermoplasmata archaeon]
MEKTEAELKSQIEIIKKGGAEKYHVKAKERGKLFVRERLKLLLDDDSFAEDGMFANVLDGKLPADGVVCGVGKLQGRSVAIMANDSTIKAGSWGWRTVEKIVRIQETATKLKVPLIYLVDSAGARITDQVEMFPGRRGAGRIFYNEANISGFIPQICGLFGPSAAGGAYIPAFCDVTYMVEGNASMYLGSPRMAEMVIGEKVTLEEMGGARMHCTTSGSGDMLCKTEEEVIEAIKKHISYFPQNCDEKPADIPSVEPELSCNDLENIIPKNENIPFDMNELIRRVVDRDSFLEVKKLYAPELIVGFSRIGGKSIGIIANQPMVKGGVLFVESAYKGAKFMQLCDAFNIPLLWLADVPGFMIGTAVEKQGIIRAGARMIFSVSQATVPKVSIIVRKAYGAGLYAMAGPGYEPDTCLALPTAMIAVMGPEAAVNAVFFNKIQALPEEERPAYIQKLREEYRQDVDIYKLGAEMVTDGMVAPSELRNEIINRFKKYESKEYHLPKRRHGVIP